MPPKQATINHDDVLAGKFGHPITQKGKGEVLSDKKDNPPFMPFIVGVIVGGLLVYGVTK